MGPPLSKPASARLTGRPQPQKRPNVTPCKPRQANAEHLRIGAFTASPNKRHQPMPTCPLPVKPGQHRMGSHWRSARTLSRPLRRATIQFEPSRIFLERRRLQHSIVQTRSSEHCLKHMDWLNKQLATSTRDTHREVRHDRSRKMG